MTYRGAQVAAARALAGLTIVELAELAGVTERTVRRIEAFEVVPISAKPAHGFVAQETWLKVVRALDERGIELTSATDRHGAGVRWKR